MNTLPDKTSELIRVAHKDLEACEKDPNYEIRMTDWHEPNFGICCVCLAGSVMAKSLEISMDEDKTPNDFSLPIYRKLWALNVIRHNIEYKYNIYHHNKPELFKQKLLEIADEYEKAGN